MDLFLKALNNDIVEINEYLRNGDANIIDINKCSLLHYAARNGAIEVGELLINNLIDINLLDNNGESPIFYAVRFNQFDFFKMLVCCGATLDIINNRNESLLMVSMRYAKDEFSLFLMNKYNYNVLSCNNDGENLLFLALYANKTKLFLSLANAYPDLLFKRDCHNRNLLMLSLKYHNDEITKFLLKNGLKIYQLDNELNNSLFYAFKYADYEILQYLLTFKPIIEGKNIYGNSIFDEAIHNPFGITSILNNYQQSFDYNLYKKTYPEFIAIINKNYDLLEALNPKKNKRDVYGTSLNDLCGQVNDENINKLIH